MTKNVESQATTITGQNENGGTAQNKAVQSKLIHNVDNHPETIDDCFISKKTWNFLACILALHDLYGKVSDALIAMYGEIQADRIVNKEFDKTYEELESILYGFVNDSIRENICIVGFNKI